MELLFYVRPKMANSEQVQSFVYNEIPVKSNKKVLGAGYVVAAVNISGKNAVSCDK